MVRNTIHWVEHFQGCETHHTVSVYRKRRLNCEQASKVLRRFLGYDAKALEVYYIDTDKST